MICGALDPVRKEAGRQIYNARCYFCHGYRGNADTAAARYLEPRPRDFSLAVEINPADMRSVIASGRTNTAMQGFKGTLSVVEIDSVAAFIEEEFIRCQQPNARYHSAENGWPEHGTQNAPAYPFVMGALPIDSSPGALSPENRNGQAIFRASCIICHEGRRGTDGRDRGEDSDEHIEDEAHEYDRAYGSAEETPHDRAPILANVTPQEALGARLYQENCALCHAADGTGKNWIGGFLQPHPPDFTKSDTVARLDDARLREVIVSGLPDSSMPAFGAVLASEQIAVIAAYIKHAFSR